MSNIYFRPWVGKNYSTTGYKGKKILVLGESHYCKEHEKYCPTCQRENMKESCSSMTDEVVNELASDYYGQGYLQCFVCFERAVTGKELSQKEREEFWNGVMFYNYIQFSQTGPRTAPLPEHWGQSEPAFQELLEQYMPDYIIVWGARLYDGLPDLGGVGSKLTIDGLGSTDVWTYTVKGKQIPALKVHHPSAPIGKKRDYWHQFYKAFLKV